MAKMMILGVKDEAGLWLVDFEAGTVTAMDGNRNDYISGEVAAAFNSADVALPFEIKEEAFSGLYYKTSGAVDVAVPFDVKEEAFSGQFFKTPPVAGKHSLQS